MCLAQGNKTEMPVIHTFYVVFHQDGLLHRFSVHSLHHKAENIIKVNTLGLLLKPTKINCC